MMVDSDRSFKFRRILNIRVQDIEIRLYIHNRWSKEKNTDPSKTGYPELLADQTLIIELAVAVFRKNSDNCMKLYPSSSVHCLRLFIKGNSSVSLDYK